MTSDFSRLVAATPGLPCRPDPALFHSDYPPDRRRAQGLCAGCPLLAACEAYAVASGQVWGVWGGRDFTAVVTYCGTERGHQIHVRNGEAACGPCREVHARRLERARRAQLAIEHAKGGTVRGYDIHLRLEEVACGLCKAASREKSRQRREQARRGLQRPRTASPASGSTATLPGAQAGVHGLAAAS
ncbi:WhiB family transcriptional regulator [Streptomyces sp. NBC_01171]|uniref:WhiB family transcriptional regulator n=1 Tax=Streptomyces sp. NBC_01171 TaxID=2903757 RepID=UPI003863051B|nr:WhiB family transcriptional regulator [Streptomyces sp. NBC_01171]